jgi:hypothetical protein
MRGERSTMYEQSSLFGYALRYYLRDLLLSLLSNLQRRQDCRVIGQTSNRWRPVSNAQNFGSSAETVGSSVYVGWSRLTERHGQLCLGTRITVKSCACGAPLRGYGT